MNWRPSLELAKAFEARVRTRRLASLKTSVLGGSKPDTSYNYRLIYRRAGGEAVQDAMRSFHTQRKAGSKFSFVMQADSHLDNNTDVRVYQQSLANMLTDKPDFMIDLGDTTMVDKFGRFYTRSESQYKAQRYYMGRMAHSVPIFMVLGDHDGERGSDPGDVGLVAQTAPHLYPQPDRWQRQAQLLRLRMGKRALHRPRSLLGHNAGAEPPAGT